MSDTSAAFREEFSGILEAIERLHRQDIAQRAEIERLLALVERKDIALQSIASNTCCDKCREAALVAAKALSA